MLVAVRTGGSAIWQGNDSGSFDLLVTVGAGDTVDFLVYGGHCCGNTPLEAIISLIPSGGAIYLRQSSHAIVETTATLQVEVLRFGPDHLDEEVTIDYATVDGTAHAGEDYVTASGTLHFAAGEINKQITIPILNDNLKEVEEQFSSPLR